MLIDAVAVCLAFMCLVAIISPAVPTGIVITVGLGMMATAATWAAADDSADPRGVMQLLLVASLTIGAGVAWRMRRRRVRHGRQRTDWGDLDTCARPIDDQPLSQGRGGD